MSKNEPRTGWLGLFQRASSVDSELEKQVSLQEKTLKQAKKKKDYAKQAIALDHLGFTHLRLGNPQTALDHWIEILTLYNRSKHRAVLATTYGNMASAYRIKNELENAKRFYQKSFAINQQNGSKPGLLIDCYNLAMTAAETADYPDAMSLLDQALTLANDLNEALWTTYLVKLKSDLLFFLCRHREALEGYEFVLNESDRLKRTDWSLQALCGICQCYLRLGDYYSAYQCMEDAQEVADTVSLKWLRALVKTQFGELILQLGDPDKARKLALDAKNLTSDEIDSTTTVVIYRLMAQVNAQRGMSENSRKYYEHARELTQQSRNRMAEAQVLYDVASLDFMEGKHREAYGVATQTARLVQEVGDRYLDCELSILQGRIYQAMGELEKSQAAREKALVMAKELKCPELIWKAHYNLGRLYHAHKRLDAAYSHYISAVEMLDFVASHLRTNVLAGIYFSEKDRIKVFQDLILLLVAKDRRDEAKYYYNRIELPEIKEKLKHLFRND